MKRLQKICNISTDVMKVTLLKHILQCCNQSHICYHNDMFVISHVVLKWHINFSELHFSNIVALNKSLIL